MSQLDKVILRLINEPRDYTYTEAKYLLKHLGYKEYNKGKTSGSRVKFYRENDHRIILLLKPHPSDIMKRGAIRYLREYLMKVDDIS